MHAYYTKHEDIMTAPVKSDGSWIMKTVLKQRDIIMQTQLWQTLQASDKFKAKDVYLGLREMQPKVQWRKVLYDNMVRPRPYFTLWLACHERLATKDRMKIFGMIDDDCCCFCQKQESKASIF